MSERLFCKINQQPCGTDGLGNGNGSCGSCYSSKKFLGDIFETLEPSGAENFWTEDRGDTLVAGYKRGERDVKMRIQRGDTVG
jgi:hypothetical protein